MSATTFQQSSLVLDSTGTADQIPDGWKTTFIYGFDDGEKITKESLYFESGVATKVINSFAGTKAMATTVDTDVWPPQYHATMRVTSTGVSRMFANESLKIPPAFFTEDFITLNGQTSSEAILFDNGACLTINSLGADGCLHLNLNGAYDYLDPTETAIFQIPYTIEEPSLSAELWDEATIVTYSATFWDDTDPEYYEKIDTTPFADLKFAFPDGFLDGAADMSFVVGFKDVTNKFEIYWMDSSGNRFGGAVGSKNNAAGVSEFSFTTTPPENAAGLLIKSNTGTLGSVKKTMQINALIPAEIFNIDIQIDASEDVGAKLVSTDGYAGTNWVKSGSEYTATAGNTEPLTASVSMTEGKLYIIPMTVESRTAGSINVSLIGDATAVGDHSLDSNDRDVWTIQAPANVTEIQITRTSDFDGTIKDIFAREVLLTGDACDIYLHGDDYPNLSESAELGKGAVKTEGAAGEIKLMWMMEPVSGRISADRTPQHYETGDLGTEGSEFGVRITDTGFTNTYVVENAESLAKRSAVSTKGGEFADLWNLQVTGGYTGTSENFQTGFIPADNDPWMINSQVCHFFVDLLLNPMTDNYATQNSDGVVMNGNGTAGTYFANYWGLNSEIKNIADAGYDNKLTGFVNYWTIDGGHRGLRNHRSAHKLIANSEIIQQTDTECAIHIDTLSERFLLWNTTIDGVRVLNSQQMVDILKTDGIYAGVGQLESNAAIWQAQRCVEVLKTWPRIPDQCRINATSFEFEISPVGAGTWATLSVPNVGLMNRGCFKRILSYAAGTYDIRGRALYAEKSAGNWSPTRTVTVS